MATNTLAENVTQAISDFADIRTAIEGKGVTVASGTPTSDYGSLITKIPSGGDIDVVKTIVERPENAELVLPEGIVKIADSTFEGFTNLISVTIPDSVISIGSSAFSNCSGLAEISVSSNIQYIGSGAINYTAYYNNSLNWTNNKLLYLESFPIMAYYCVASKNLSTGFSQNITLNSFTKVIGANALSYKRDIRVVSLNSGLRHINDRAFAGNYMTTINLPNSLISIGEDVFYECSDLQTVTIENGFNCDNLDLSSSTKYSTETIVNWLNALYDRTGLTAYTLTIGSTNLAKLTSQEIAIATNKNWNLA